MERWFTTTLGRRKSFESTEVELAALGNRDEMVMTMRVEKQEQGGNGEVRGVNIYHELWLGMTFPLDHFRIKALRKGVQRAHVGAGSQPTMNTTKETDREVEGARHGVVGGVALCGLDLRYRTY